MHTPFTTSLLCPSDLAAQLLTTKLKGRSPFPRHLCLIGQRGSGKSYALKAVSLALQDRFETVALDIHKVLDPYHFHFIALVWHLQEKLLAIALAQSISLSQECQNLLQQWRDHAQVQRMVHQYTAWRAETNFTVNVELQLYISLRKAARYSASMKLTLQDAVEPTFGSLCMAQQALMRDVKRGLQDGHGRELLILIDGLEQVPLEYCNQALFLHLDILRRWEAHWICAVPDSWTMFQEFRYFLQFFDDAPCYLHIPPADQLMPMLSEHIFEDKALCMQTLEASGGCMADLKTILKEAIQASGMDSSAIIRQKHIDRGIAKLRSDYQCLLADGVPIGLDKIPWQEFKEELRCFLADSHALPRHFHAHQILRHYNALLEVDETMGWKVHPLLVASELL